MWAILNACLLIASILRRSGVFWSSASPLYEQNAVGMQRVSSFKKAYELGSQAVYPLASNVALNPPDGNEEASGSPFISSFPENSIIICPSSVGTIKLSCFSAVIPVSGWNQCVKCVAPFSIAQSFIADATVSAILLSIPFPSLMALLSILYVSFGRRSTITESLNTLLPKSPVTLSILCLRFKNQLTTVQFLQSRLKYSAHLWQSGTVRFVSPFFIIS